MNHKSKPCPFCGAEQIEVRQTVTINRYWVRCRVCGAEGPSGISEKAAVNRWNRRESENL